MKRLVVAVLLTAVMLVASLTSLLRKAQTCACEQTYMYSSYTEVPVLSPRWSRHRYKLRLYRETGYSRQALPPTGLPALLIPGNAGSYEQVRSLASETSRLAAKARKAGRGSSTITDIDWYALDLNGELSAFDGHLLAEQTAFAVACLGQLRAMYSSSSSSTASPHMDPSKLPYNLRPQLEGQMGSISGTSSSNGGSAAGPPADVVAAGGVVLVGHSMGGVVARAAAAAAWLDPQLGPGSIALLLTLASPQRYPPLLLQPGLARFYGSAAAQPLPADLPVVSVHGGAADMQVSPYLTRLPGTITRRWARYSRSSYYSRLSSSSSTTNSSRYSRYSGTVGDAAGRPVAASLSLSSQHIPGVWLAAGHTQIDWCNQLVKRLSAVLMEVHAKQQQRQQQQVDSLHEQLQSQQGHQGRALLQQSVQPDGGANQPQGQQQQQHQQQLPLVSEANLCFGSNTTCQSMPSSPAAPATWQVHQLGQFWRPEVSANNKPPQPGHSDPAHSPWHVRSLRAQCDKHAGQQQHKQRSSNKDKQQWRFVNKREQAAPADSAAGDTWQQQFQQGKQGLVQIGVVLRPSQLASAVQTPADGDATDHLQLDSGPETDPSAAAAAEGEGADVGFHRQVARSMQEREMASARSSSEAAAAAATASSHWQGVAATSGLLQQFLTSRVQQALGVPHSSTTTCKRTDPQTHSQQQQRHQQHSHSRQHAAHSRPKHQAGIAAAAADCGPGHPRQQDLLLAAVAPEDVILAQTGSCPEHSPNPQWFIDSQQAAARVVPGHLTSMKARPEQATGAGGVGSGGAVYFWDVRAAVAAAAGGGGGGSGAADLVLVVSGAKPCTGFRIWLQQHNSGSTESQTSGAAVAAQAGSNDSSGSNSGSGIGSAASSTAGASSAAGTAEEQQAGGGGAAAAAAAAAGTWVDVTGLAAPLPALNDELVSEVRDYSRWLEVMHGIDYLQSAAWTLALNHQQHFVAPGTSRLAIWLAPAAAAQHGSPTSSSSGGSKGGNVTVQAIPSTASLTMQWQPLQVQHKLQAISATSSSSSSSSRPSLQVGPAALLWPLVRPAGGAMLLQLQLRWQWLLHGLSLRVHASAPPSAPTAAGAGSTAASAAGGVPGGDPSSSSSNNNDNSSSGSSWSSSGGSCWHPVVVYASRWGGLEHIAMLNTTRTSQRTEASSSSSSSSAGASLLVQLKQLVQPWLYAGKKASTQAGSTASSSNSVPLSDVLPGSSLQLLLDPGCSYSISLGWDVVDSAAQVLLAHASAAAGMAVALLLLVLSHQMSALVRLMTVARHGLSSAAAAGGSSADAAAGNSGAYSSSSNKKGLAGDSGPESPVIDADGQPDGGGPDRAAAASLDLRQLYVAALQRIRKRLDGTLGGAPPPVHKYYAAAAGGVGAGAPGPADGVSGPADAGPDGQAAGISNSPGGLSGVGVSVLESLVAVTYDVRVLLLAALLAAAATELNWLNPNSLWYFGTSATAGGAAVPDGLLGFAGWLVHLVLWLLGLEQRGDSPGVVGAALLLGLALLFLLLDVWLSVGMKWCLDWCSAAVAAFNRSLTPDPATLAAIAAASSGGSYPQAGQPGSSSGRTPCACALCVAADAACGGTLSAAGGFFGGSLCGLGSCCDDGAAAAARDQRYANHVGAAGVLQQDGAVAPAAAVVDRHISINGLGAASGVSSSTVAPAAAAGVPAGVPWWWQRKCQLQLVVLLLLTVANISLGLAGSVLLLFFTWHLPSNSSAAAARVAELLLGSRANSRAASRAASRASSPNPAMRAAAAAGSNITHQHQLPARLASVAESVDSDAAATAAVMGMGGARGDRRIGGGPAAVIMGSYSKERDTRPVRSDAGLLLDDDDAGEDGGSDDDVAGEAAAAGGYYLAPNIPAFVPVQPDSPQDSAQAAAAATGAWNSTSLPAEQLMQKQQQQQLVGAHAKLQAVHDSLPYSTAAAPAAVGSGSLVASQVLGGAVATRHDAAAARAVALHQLTCHMCHAWTLLYGCCCLMLLPSLLAWMQLPLGQQHLSHPLDVLLLLPVLLHCIAISAGTVKALVGYGPATAAAARRAKAAVGPSNSPLNSRAVMGTAAVLTSGPGSNRRPRPVDLYKLVVRCAAVYMFAAALLGQSVVWLGVVCVVACLMLGGELAVQGWQQLHVWVYVRLEPDFKLRKQKGT